MTDARCRWKMAVQAKSAQRGRMRIKFWGVRGSTPTPQSGQLALWRKHLLRRSSLRRRSLHLRLRHRISLAGPGTATRVQGKAVNAHIFVSHFHWDHIQGIPFFAPLYDKPENSFSFHSSSRTRTLKRVMEEQMAAPYFPVDMSEMKVAARLLQHGARKSAARRRDRRSHVAQPSTGLYGFSSRNQRRCAGLRHRQRARRSSVRQECPQAGCRRRCADLRRTISARKNTKPANAAGDTATGARRST